MNVESSTMKTKLENELTCDSHVSVSFPLIDHLHHFLRARNKTLGCTLSHEKEFQANLLYTQIISWWPYNDISSFNILCLLTI